MYTDSNMERPEDRKFDADPIGKVRADRSRVIGAILTIIKAYIVAGKPNLRDYTSFGSWSHHVRSALIWLGKSDPVDTVFELRASDPVATNRESFYLAWSRLPKFFSGKGYTVQELVHIGENEDGKEAQDFEDAILKIASVDRKPDTIDNKKLGNYLSRHKNTISGGFKLSMDSSVNKQKPRWILTQIGVTQTTENT